MLASAEGLAKDLECHLQVTCGVDEKIAGLQIPMKHIGRVNVFQPSKNLIEKVADMVVAELLGLQKLIEIRLHQILNYISEKKTNNTSLHQERGRKGSCQGK